MPRHYDLGNLLLMLDESVSKIINHLEKGKPEAALLRSQQVHEVLQMWIKHCAGDINDEVGRRI